MVDFNINKLTTDQQEKFHLVYEQLKDDYKNYLEYKQTQLNLPDPSENYLSQEDYLKDDENEWKFMITRYLRARKWNIPQTVKSIRDTIQWRKQNNVDRILLDMSQQHLDLSRKYIPNGYHGFTKKQNPIYVEKTGKIKLSKCLEKFSMDQILQGHIHIQELNCRRAREKSRECGKHIETIVTIMDFDGLEFFAGQRAIPLLKEFLHIDSNHYPERMGSLFAVNAPLFFPIIWDLMKPFVDPVTASKVFVLRKTEATKTLLHHIDSDQLPKEYQGTCQSCTTIPHCIHVYELPENN